MRSVVRLPDHAALGPRPILRTTLLGAFLVLLQLSLLDRIGILGVRLDLSILGMIVVGLLAGPAVGAGFGFGVGLFLDLLSGQALGMTSLVFTAVGYGAGTFGTLRDPDSGAATLVAGTVGTFVTLAAYGLLQLLAIPDQTTSGDIVGQTIGTVVAGAVFALPLHNRIGRWLQPMLPEETRRRRRSRDRPRSVRRPSSDVRIR